MKFSLSRICRGLAIGLNLTLCVSYAYGCDIKTTVKQAGISEIERYFENSNKQVLTFIGYSGAEYEDRSKMLSLARRILAEYDAGRNHCQYWRDT